MQPLIWDRRPDGLRAPAMVCSFQGWNDAGDAASTATGFLAQALGARRFARIDSEEFYDFQANRPHVKIDETQARVISWPSVEVFEARAPRAHREVVIVQGTEPSMRWRSFSSLVVDLAEALDVQLVVTLGGLLADVPHSQPVSMTGFVSDPALMARLALNASSYEGPTGIVGVLHAGFGQAGLPSASIWASVPHYVAAAASPKAALALLRKLELMVGVSVDVTELEEAAAEYERQVGLAVRSDPDIQAFVDRLEQRAVEDGQAEISPQDLPSGDLLARDDPVGHGGRAHQQFVRTVFALGSRRLEARRERELFGERIHDELDRVALALGGTDRRVGGLAGSVRADDAASGHLAGRDAGGARFDPADHPADSAFRAAGVIVDHEQKEFGGFARHFLPGERRRDAGSGAGVGNGDRAVAFEGGA